MIGENSHPEDMYRDLHDELEHASSEYVKCKRVLDALISKIESANDLHAVFTIKDSPEFQKAKKLDEKITNTEPKAYNDDEYLTVRRLFEVLKAHRRFHDKVGCPGRPECYVCAAEEWFEDYKDCKP